MTVNEISQYLLQNIQDTKALEDFLYNLRRDNLKQGVEAVLLLLNDSNEKIRTEAMWFIEMLNPQDENIIPALKEAAKDINPYVRSHAVVYLAEKKLTKMVTELVEVLKDDRFDSSIRSRAAILLARHSSPETTDVLVQSLNDENPTVVWTVMHAIQLSKSVNSENEIALERIKNIYKFDNRVTLAGLSLSQKAYEVLQNLSTS